MLWKSPGALIQSPQNHLRESCWPWTVWVSEACCPEWGHSTDWLPKASASCRPAAPSWAQENKVSLFWQDSSSCSFSAFISFYFWSSWHCLSWGKQHCNIATLQHRGWRRQTQARESPLCLSRGKELFLPGPPDHLIQPHEKVRRGREHCPGLKSECLSNTFVDLEGLQWTHSLKYRIFFFLMGFCDIFWNHLMQDTGPVLWVICNRIVAFSFTMVNWDQGRLTTCIITTSKIVGHS